MVPKGSFNGLGVLYWPARKHRSFYLKILFLMLQLNRFAYISYLQSLTKLANFCNTFCY